MLLENVQVLPLPDLPDLLVITTTQMHNMIREKETDITVNRDMRKDVQFYSTSYFKEKIREFSFAHYVSIEKLKNK